MAPERQASGSRIAAPSTTRAKTMNGGEKSRSPTLMNRYDAPQAREMSPMRSQDRRDTRAGSHPGAMSAMTLA
jgi:hypothetical protein